MESKESDPRRLLTVQELAAFLNVERKTIYRLPIEFVRVGSHRRYRPSDVEAYLSRPNQ